jgi:hypothetical protein
MFGSNNNTSWNTVILVKLTGPKLVKKIKTHYILWRNVHYHFHNSTPPVPVIHQFNTDHASSDCLKIHFNIIVHFKPRSSTLYLSLKHPHQNGVCTFFLLRATCLAHRIFLYFITWMIFGEEYREEGSKFLAFSALLSTFPA